MSSSFYEQAHRLAQQLGVELTDPPAVLDAQERQNAWAELKSRPAPQALADRLATTAPKEWSKVLDAAAVAHAEHTLVRDADGRAFQRAFDQTVREHADTYLTVLAPAVDALVVKALTAGTHVTTTDHRESVARGEGLALHEVERATAAVAAYSTLLNPVTTKITTDGLPVWRGLAVIDPGNIPAEVLDRHTLTRRRLNPPDEGRHVDAARAFLRQPTTALPELVTDVIVNGHEWFTIAIPITVAQAQQQLQRWNEANSVHYSEQ